MTNTEFMRPKLIGERFEGKAIPLEFLKDFAVLEEMIIEVAKHEFREDHPDRKRTPRGFAEGVTLKLTGIEGGSAIPVIDLFVDTTTRMQQENQKYCEKARDLIISAVAAAENGDTITKYLSGKLLGYFNRMGQSLREGEAMEFVTPSIPVAAKLNRETRLRLVNASASTREIAEETEVRGLIPEVDQDNRRFELQLPGGNKIKAPINPQHRDAILEVFNGYRDEKKALIQGVVVMNLREKLIRFDSVEHVSALEILDIAARIDDLRFLEDGWFEGTGKAPSKEGLDWLETFLKTHYPDETVLPRLYPSPEGDIRAEWWDDQWALSLDIHFANRHGTWHELNLKTDEDEMLDLNLEDEKDWSWLIRRLDKCLGKAT